MFSLRETSVRTDGYEMPAVRKQGGGAVGTFAWGAPWKPWISTTNGPVSEKQSPPHCQGKEDFALHKPELADGISGTHLSACNQ